MEKRQARWKRNLQEQRWSIESWYLEQWKKDKMDWKRMIAYLFYVKNIYYDDDNDEESKHWLNGCSKVLILL